MIEVLSLSGYSACPQVGVLADQRVFHRLGLRSASVPTVMTVQNGLSFQRQEPILLDVIMDQLDSIMKIGCPKVIKLGVLPNAGLIATLSEYLRDRDALIVCDPVLRSSSDHSFLDQTAIATLIEQLLPHVDVLTPNLDEARRLSAMAIDNTDQMCDAAKIIHQMGVQHVVIKGGHLAGEVVQDLWFDGKNQYWLNQNRIPVQKTHGTGCHFAAALSAYLAQGESLSDALVLAKQFTHAALMYHESIEQTAFVGLPQADQLTASHFPWLSDSAYRGQHRYDSIAMDDQLGFYPIVDNLDLLNQIKHAGMRALQLRIKAPYTPEIRTIIHHAYQQLQDTAVQLIINDHWQAALELDGVGLHLGQDDLADSDIELIKARGLPLGISTHSVTEIARALTYGPAYIAIGPIFKPLSKAVSAPPLGLVKLKKWRQSIDLPLIAIGGITMDSAAAIMACGVDGFCAISALRTAHPFASCRALVHAAKASA